jgi:hypothetical protein
MHASFWERVKDGALDTVGWIVGAGFVLLFALAIGFNFPVVRQHCLEGGGFRADVQIDSTWKVVLDTVPQDDVELCVRNSPSRELLNAVGIWDLPDPETQVKDALATSVGDVTEGGEEYLRLLIELREESDAAGAVFAEDIRAASSPQKLRAAMVGAETSASDVIAELEATTPPPEFADLHDTALEINEKTAEASRNVIAAIDSGDGDAVAAAFREFLAVTRAVRDDYRELRERIKAEAEQE